jgi:hypothetical protein
MNKKRTLNIQINCDATASIDEAALQRQARREERLGDLRKVRLCTELAIEKLGQYIAGNAPLDEARPFLKIRDPGRSLEGMRNELRKLVALEERIGRDIKASAARAEQRRRQTHPPEDKKDPLHQAVRPSGVTYH